MDGIVINKTWIQGKRPEPDCLGEFAYQGENLAHTINVSGKTATGTAVNVTGTIKGVYLGENNVSVPLTGSVNDGVASLTLTDDCYAIPGKFILSIYAQNTETLCIYCGIGHMFRTESERVSITSVSDILDVLDRAQEVIDSIPEDYSELSADVSDLKTALDNGYVIRNITAGTDMDTLYENGYYFVPYSGSLTNSPDGVETGRRMIFVYSSVAGNQNTLRYQFYVNFTTAELWMRFRGPGASVTYDAWKQLNKWPTNTNAYIYNNSAVESATPNVGHTVRVLTYNVGRYNYGSSTSGLDISEFDRKVFNLKKLLMKCGADYCGIQEDTETCDRAQTKNAHQYIYSPLYPFRESLGGASCYGKAEPTSSGNRSIAGDTENRYMAYQFYSIASKTLLFVSLHLSSDTFANRKAQIANLFSWLANQTYDWCIIAGDFNLLTSDDKNASVNGSLPYAAAQNGFTMANGGYLGWVYTTPTDSTDNILCSSNCIINKIECYDDLYENLVSDHYPMMAEIVLTD